MAWYDRSVAIYYKLWLTFFSWQNLPSNPQLTCRKLTKGSSMNVPPYWNQLIQYNRKWTNCVPFEIVSCYILSENLREHVAK